MSPYTALLTTLQYHTRHSGRGAEAPLRAFLSCESGRPPRALTQLRGPAVELNPQLLQRSRALYNSTALYTLSYNFYTPSLRK